MKIMHIYPRQFSFLSTYQDYELLLYHEAITFDSYRSFFKNCANYKILDNSFYELRKEVPYEDVISVGKEMNIHEIILPDKLGDGEWTRTAIKDNLKNYLPIYKKQGWSIAGVVQGKDLQDCMETFYFLLTQKNINVIMVPRKVYRSEVDNTYYSGRYELLYEILANYRKQIKMSKKEIHLLGANSWGDFYPPYSRYIRSIDTKMLVKTLTNGWKWKNWEDRYITSRLSQYIREEADYLIRCILKHYYGVV